MRSGARRRPVAVLLAQEPHRLDAVGDVVQRVPQLVVLERLADHELVAGIVLDEQDVDHTGFGLRMRHRATSSTILRVRASPMPVPS